MSEDSPISRSNYNYAAAFLDFARGATIADCADKYGIPRSTLQATANQQSWLALASEMPLTPAPMSDRLKMTLEVIQANRQENYKIACKLRQDLINVIENMTAPNDAIYTEEARNGEPRVRRRNKMLRCWHNRGSVTEHEVDWSISDRVQLATYAQTIANLTYQALGDKQTTGESQRNAKDEAPPASITIILPGAIAKPRNERGKDVVLDMTTVQESSPLIEDVKPSSSTT